MAIKEVRILLVGLGTVNIGLLKILGQRRNEVEKLYNLTFRIVGVADSSGVALNTNGFNYEDLITLKTKKGHASGLQGFIEKAKTENISELVHADLLIESSPGNLKTGQPGLETVRRSLTHSCSVVLANKAPLVFAFDELHELAKNHGSRLAFSATVCGGLPVVNVLKRDLKLATLKSLRGILNATTNFILHYMGKGGSMTGAIREAQRLGAAEADPTHDVHGHDAANKLFIIMKSFTDFSGSVADIEVHGIQDITLEKIQMAKDQGNKIKLLATARPTNTGWSLSVSPVEIPASSFLGTCDGWEMGLEVETDLYEAIAMKNFEADPVGTSAAVLRDMIELSAQ